MSINQKLELMQEVEKRNDERVKVFRTLRYSRRGLGYDAWTPEAGKGLPDLWFSSLEDIREFANNLGYRLKSI